MTDGSSNVQVGDVLHTQGVNYLVINKTPTNMMVFDTSQLTVRWVTTIGQGTVTKMEHAGSLIHAALSRLIANKVPTMSTEDRVQLIRFLMLELMV